MDSNNFISSSIQFIFSLIKFPKYENKRIEYKNNSVKAKFLRNAEEKKYFSQSKCVLLISVGSPAHEGEKFSALLRIVNTAFKACDILVCDTLQRHNMIEYSSNEAYKISLEAGAAWVERNRKYLKCLTIPHEIHHWNRYIECPQFNKYYIKTAKAYSNDKDIHKAIDDTVDEYIRRKKPDADKSTRMRESSRRYLIEENSVLMYHFANNFSELNYSYVVYPGNIPAPIDVMSKKMIAENPQCKVIKWQAVSLRSCALPLSDMGLNVADTSNIKMGY